MKKKSMFFGVAVLLLATVSTVNSQQQQQRVPWQHYKPEVCLTIDDNGELIKPVCVTPIMNGPCDIPMTCAGILIDF